VARMRADQQVGPDNNYQENRQVHRAKTREHPRQS
jgi:hypothetical protein